MATTLDLGRSNTVPTLLKAFGAVWPMRTGEAWGGATTIATTQIPANIDTELQWFDDRSSVKANVAWVSDYVAQPFTLAGTVTFAIRAYESATTVNIGLRGKLIRLPWDQTEDMAVVASANRSGEIATSATDYTWTATPTSTLFKVNDRLMFQGFWYPTSATGTGTAEINGAGSANKYVQITEDVTFSTSPILIPIRSVPVLGQPRPLF